MVQKKPGGFVNIGTRNEAKGCVFGVHNEKMQLDEDVLINGSKVFVQYVLDNK